MPKDLLDRVKCMQAERQLKVGVSLLAGSRDKNPAYLVNMSSLTDLTNLDIKVRLKSTNLVHRHSLPKISGFFLDLPFVPAINLYIEGTSHSCKQ